MLCISLSVLLYFFRLVIVLSVLILYTDSDYYFGIYKLFLPIILLLVVRTPRVHWYLIKQQIYLVLIDEIIIKKTPFHSYVIAYIYPNQFEYLDHTYI